MTSSEPMSREDLVELATLDAYGLLDQYEAALFTRSFHHAPAAVQDEILRLQAEVAAEPVLVPDESPPAELRERTLRAVSKAIELEHSRLAPIASIGHHRGGTSSGASSDLALVRRDAAGARKRRVAAVPTSTNLWRAAAFVLCGAVIVLAYFQTERERQNERIWEMMLSELTQAQVVEEIGPDFAYFVSHPRKASRPLAAPSDAGCLGMVNFIEPDEPGAPTDCFVVVIGLPKSSTKYAVRVHHEDGRVETLGNGFISNGTIGAMQLGKLSSALVASATFEIVDAAGSVVMTTTV